MIFKFYYNIPIFELKNLQLYKTKEFFSDCDCGFTKMILDGFGHQHHQFPSHTYKPRDNIELPVIVEHEYKVQFEEATVKRKVSSSTRCRIS